MRYEDLNWMDVENYLLHDDRLIIVIGACEQHAYLSLLSDVKIPLALADSASRQTNVLIAPPLNFGASPYFLSYPGTMSLRITTLLDVVEDLVRSAYRQGFRRILILNGHGGNDGARARLYEVTNDLPDLHIAWYAWWTAHSVAAVATKYNLKPTHASWLEAFSFTTVAEHPTENKHPAVISGLLNTDQARLAYGDGNFGGPYTVDPAIMEEIFQAALADVLQLLKFE
jgi:creatinine amidohydrolase